MKEVNTPERVINFLYTVMCFQTLAYHEWPSSNLGVYMLRWIRIPGIQMLQIRKTLLDIHEPTGAFAIAIK